MNINFVLLPLILGLMLVSSTVFSGGDLAARILVGMVGVVSIIGAVGLYLEFSRKLKIAVI